VKDNVAVRGLRTTAGCPASGTVATADATMVARLRAAGAVVIGTTNLDQFVTGLVGTRTPHGPVRARGARAPVGSPRAPEMVRRRARRVR
jgi:allophanate hydrolase